MDDLQKKKVWARDSSRIQRFKQKNLNGKGWHQEYERHALAGMGIKTGRKDSNALYHFGKSYSALQPKEKRFVDSIKGVKVNLKGKKQLDKTLTDLKKDVALLKEKKDVVHHFDEFTTSDLQGTVEALAKEYDVDDEELLQEIIIAHNYKTKKLQDEYLDSKEFDKYRIVRRKEKEVFNHG